MDKDEKLVDLDELVSMSDEEIQDIDKMEEKRRKKEERKAQKEVYREEKRQIRSEKRRILKRNFILFLKIFYSIGVASLTGFINSCAFLFFGYSKLSMLIAIPAIFILIGLFIPLIWIKSEDRGFFFLMWLLCILMFVVGLFLPTLLFEWNTLVVGVNGVLELLRSLFGS